nr:uncharacterized protein LOC112995327 [Dromaius novaehollandiae]
MVNKDMNGFPAKKCSAFQFFKKRVRRWIKSPVVSIEKHPNASLKYPGSTVMHFPQGDAELESSLCQTCLSDHPFPRGIVPQEAESCSWKSQRSSKAKEPSNKGNLLAQPEPGSIWGGDDSVYLQRICMERSTFALGMDGIFPYVKRIFGACWISSWRHRDATIGWKISLGVAPHHAAPFHIFLQIALQTVIHRESQNSQYKPKSRV